MASVSSSDTNKSSKLNLAIDLRFVVIILLLVIIGMLAFWKPWSPAISSTARTISVTGESTIKATPDEYIFSPSYDFKDADKTAALNALTARQTEIVAGLKKLGVTDSMIKADSSGYNQNYYYYDANDNTYDYTLSMTVTLDSAALSQKVQDYLVTTSPTGSVSPTADFSTTKRKTLEAQGRDLATKDARSKADQSATNLGFKIGAVKTVTDGSDNGGIVPLYNSAISSNLDSASGTSASPSLGVQPGQNELDYSVTVVYYLK